MFSRLVSTEDAVQLLDLGGAAPLEQAEALGMLMPVHTGSQVKRFKLSDVVIFKLAQVIEHTGVEGPKALRYAEAILGPRMDVHDGNVVEWVENEAQELYCMIADGQLARIFLRSKADRKEVDVGAVKPVLLPSTRCEINVFRVIRPVIWRARQLLGPY